MWSTFKNRWYVAQSTLGCWFDSSAMQDVSLDQEQPKADWFLTLPFVIIHLLCLTVFWVGFSPIALISAVVLYAVRMFAITGFYHRYFSHRTFRTTRFWQFIFALLGNSAAQRGPLWWASYHRLHHKHSDTSADSHSPKVHGFWWSHLGWITTRSTFNTPIEEVKDLAKFPELRFLDRFPSLVPLLLAIIIYLLGWILNQGFPSLGTNGLQLLVWGFLISTVVLYHSTFMINSLAHVWGTRRYATNDDSRNNFFLALITFGEGWHNNHHTFPQSVRQGLFWWEIDITYYVLKLMSWLGIISDLKYVQPQRVRSYKLLDANIKSNP
ncbi:MAG: acyl-CoA desaturase [Symploca sp. SIO2E6]|nr:acyl-CoA desaturase [Symploca sp. SIO2E6]